MVYLSKNNSLNVFIFQKIAGFFNQLGENKVKASVLVFSSGMQNNQYPFCSLGAV